MNVSHFRYIWNNEVLNNNNDNKIISMKSSITDIWQGLKYISKISPKVKIAVSREIYFYLFWHQFWVFVKRYTKHFYFFLPFLHFLLDSFQYNTDTAYYKRVTRGYTCSAVTPLSCVISRYTYWNHQSLFFVFISLLKFCLVFHKDKLWD